MNKNCKKNNSLLYIARINKNILLPYILSVFKKLNIGKTHITLIEKTNYNSVLINLTWNNTEKAKLSFELLNKTNSINIIHDTNCYCFWTVSIYKPQERNQNLQTNY